MKRLLFFLKNERKMFLKLTKNDFKARYTGSYLGIAWGVIQPIITILIYWFVFTVGLRSGERPDGSPYIIWMVSGMIPWFFFSDALGAGTGAFMEYGYLVKKLNFNIGLIPLVKIGASLIIHIIFLTVTTMIFNFFGYQADWFYLQLVYYMFCNVCLVLGIVLFTSSLTVYMRDVSQLVAIVIQIGFWAIPIVWGPEVLKGKFRLLFQLNPVFYIVEGYRDSFMTHKLFFEKPVYTIYFWMFTGIFLFIGMYTFRKLKPYFADVL